MLEPDDIIPSFLDELEKIAASFSRLRIPKARAGRRSISVANFLKKDKEGSLFRKHSNDTSLVEPKRDVSDPPTAARKKYEAPTRPEVGDSPSRVVGT